jgi:hypothetical protein
VQEFDPNFGEPIDPRAFFFVSSSIEVALLGELTSARRESMEASPWLLS